MTDTEQTLDRGAACHTAHDTTLVTSAQATVHCLIGCVIGEVAGLMIGVGFGLGVWVTIGLAVFLAYVSGFTLALIPIMRRESLSLTAAMKVVWLGEAVSIAVMELAMNGVGYWMGGMHAKSLADPVFWIAMAAAIPAGYLAAWPVNHWLLKRQLKRCH